MTTITGDGSVAASNGFGPAQGLTNKIGVESPAGLITLAYWSVGGVRTDERPCTRAAAFSRIPPRRTWAVIERGEWFEFGAAAIDIARASLVATAWHSIFARLYYYGDDSALTKHVVPGLA